MSGHTGVLVLSAAFFLLLAVPLAALTWRIVKHAHGGAGAVQGRGIFLLLVAVSFSVLVLFRPHEHTFTGLDVSGYRLMAGALADGRPLLGVDKALSELPRPVRSLVLFRPEHHKPTRDISFRISSMETCRTRPFFYPTLPLAMVGFDLVVPGMARDYTVPAAGALFFCALLALCFAAAGGWGLLAGMAVLLGSLYPVWFFRGTYPESVGAILVATSMVSWIAGEEVERGPGYLECFCLGLSVTFHPLLAVLAVPALGAVVVSARDLRPWKTFLAVLAFLAGTVPLFLLTRYVTSPYGQLRIGSLAVWWERSPVMGAVMIATGAACGALLLILGFRRPMVRRIAAFREERPLLFAVLFALLLAAPTAVASWLPVHGLLIRRGLTDLWGGTQAGFTALLLMAAAYALLSDRDDRLKILALVAATALPPLLYLKGVEDPGLWSQRRLMPFGVLATAFAALSLTKMLGRLSRRSAAYASIATALIIFAGLSNAVRWPTPYLARQDRGADAWVERMEERFGESTVFFDYHRYSVPFAVGVGNRVFGFGSYAFEGMPRLMEWLAGAAGKEEILLVSAYREGWVEEGVTLVEVDGEPVTLKRARGKRGFPAVRAEKKLDLRTFRLLPEEGDPPAVMEKVFDGGRFGLRPPWGRRDIPLRTKDGRNKPAFWSREGSGIVGPLPPPGGVVAVELHAGASRKDNRGDQGVLIRPPWQGDSLRLSVGNSYSVSSGLLRRPADADAPGGGTGVYRIYAEEPYNPRKSGIRGFSRDLGVLLHKVKMELAGKVGEDGSLPTAPVAE